MEKVKISKRKEKAIETRKKIYETAEQLFKKYGFEEVSVDSIVEATGVSKGTFYVHFDSKDTLAAALISAYVNEADLDYKAYLQTFPADTATSDILISLIGKISDVITDTIGCCYMTALYKAQLAKTIDNNASMSYNRELYGMFSKIISKGIQQGEFKIEIPVDTFSKHCVMALRGLTYEWCIRYPDFNLKEEALKHFEILLAGIKKQ